MMMILHNCCAENIPKIMKVFLKELLNYFDGFAKKDEVNIISIVFKSLLKNMLPKF